MKGVFNACLGNIRHIRNKIINKSNTCQQRSDMVSFSYNMENFSNIAGHEFAKKFILSSLQKNRIAHAYLFVGPEAVGKFKFAVEFAKIIQCEIGDAGKADEQTAARREKIESGADPDVLLIDNLFFKSAKDEDDSNGQKSVSVGDVRKIEYHLSLSPYYSKYKIAIIRSAHNFTAEAANAFLKTMEEPRGNSIIILIADSVNFLPKTLVSRSQMIRFGIAREKVISDFLVRKGARAEDAEKISRISGGKAGLALDFWKNPEKIRDYYDKEKEFHRFIIGSLNERFAIIEKIAAEDGKSADILDLWLGYSRDCLIDKYAPKEYMPMEASGAGAKRLACLSAAALVKFISSLNLISKLIKTSNVNKKLALENLALEI